MIPKPTSTQLAAPYQWGDGCQGWHLVRAAGFSVIEERMPPGTKEV
ncbi:MAG: cupin, partial [Gemmatimonadetes bacterium]|nr:cupin [Gemmatimonadota bacterium]